jgi:cyclic pyranopterin phosphate synthase
MALDQFGRNIHYLRISLTDRCNLRCVYCMPVSQTFRPTPDLLQDDELLALLLLFGELGFSKFRLTGGEPTLRPNLLQVVEHLAALPNASVTLTTNGLLLPQLAAPLKAAGLQRVNISLDTLDPAKFTRITRWGKLEQVLAGIEACVQAELTPLKINAVVVRGFNEADVVDLAALTIRNPWQVRFIEMMPFGTVADFQTSQVVRASETREQIAQVLGDLQPVLDTHGQVLLQGEARIYRLAGALGTLGFISSVSEPFCASCTRARLTADGRLRLCLLREKELDLRTPLRAGASTAELKQLILDSIWQKPWGHGLAQHVIPLNRVMSEIGG